MESKLIHSSDTHLFTGNLQLVAGLSADSELNKTIHLKQIVKGPGDTRLGESMVTLTLEEFQCISQELLGTQVGIATGDALRLRHEKDQLYAHIRENLSTITEIATDESAAEQFLKDALINEEGDIETGIIISQAVVDPTYRSLLMCIAMLSYIETEDRTPDEGSVSNGTEH